MMSIVAKDYAYKVKIDKEKEEPTISLQTIERYKADIAKYLRGQERSHAG